MMSNKEKNEKEKTFPERLKRFLKSDKKGPSNFPELKLHEEQLYGLQPKAPYETRLRIIKDIEEKAHTYRLQDASVDKIWHAVKDVLTVNNPSEIRHAALTLFSTICSTSDRVGSCRLLFMKYIMDNYLKEDTVTLFNFFQCVVNDGRDIEYIEEDLGPFLVKWCPIVFSSSPSAVPMVNLVINLLKFNAAHFDDHVIQQLVLIHINQLYQSKSKEEFEACFTFMEKLIAYVYIPSGALSIFIAALARLVSVPSFVQEVWKVMRNLLRTELGNSALCSLTELIETSENFHVVRGSIYFVTCALWSKQRLASLSVGPMAILPSLLKASESLHPLVILETAVSMSKLVHQQAVDLHYPAWDLALDILERLFYFAVNCPNKEQAQIIFNVLNDSLDEIEDRIEEDQFRGTLAKFYSLVDRYSCQRKIESVHKSLEYKIRSLNCEQSHWLTHLNSLIHRHFREETRASIRLQALAKLRYIFDKYRGTSHAESICKVVVLSQFDDIEKDLEMVVRKAAVSLLTHMIISLQTPIVNTLLSFIEKVVLAPYAALDMRPKSYTSESDVADIYEGVQGLILIFKKKIWCLPSTYAIHAYHILMHVLELHYRNIPVLERVPSIRRLILEMIFEMRADADYHFGFPNCPEAQMPILSDDPSELKDLLPKYTPYIVVDHKYGQKPYTFTNQELNDSDVSNESADIVQCPAPSHGEVEEICDTLSEVALEDGDSLSFSEPKTVVTHLSLANSALSAIVALKKEKDWALLKMILEKIPQVLQNKALILSKEVVDINYLATTLCELITDDSLNIPDSLYNTPIKFSKSDFDAYVYPVMAPLASYHKYLNALFLRNIIQCLQNGMSSKSAPQCVSALTLCILETRNAMQKMLRDIMIKLSKISATVQNSQPTLEFLSTLLHLPSFYSDFLPNQYLTVFAISIPYTNPFKFNHYIVTLAYHVICMWFMKCRVQHRKGFVHFIAKNLNMILLNEETAAKMKSSTSNDQQQKGYVDMIQFHKDLRETCVDFMARNCFDSFAPEILRSPVSQLLFNEGLQQRWLVGTRIITVTTSGCSKKPIKHGLCHKCLQFCLPEGFKLPETSQGDTSQVDTISARRRHKSEFHRSVSNDMSPKPIPQTKDDLHMGSPITQFPDMGEKSQSDVGGFGGLGSSKANKQQHICFCWCSRWAEITIRQPTGNVSYAMRVLNPQTHIAKEDVVPIQDLSSFYSPFGQESEDQTFYQDQLHIADNLCLRPRAASGDSEPPREFERGSSVADEWSNSVSDLSSGAPSLASSETKLNFKSETELATIGRRNSSAVPHCLSNPEVSKMLNERVSFPGDSNSQTLSMREQKPKAETVDSKRFSYPSNAHSGHDAKSKSKSLKRRPSTPSVSLILPTHTGHDAKSKSSRTSVVRCNSVVGSPSSYQHRENNRVRHVSAMQSNVSESLYAHDNTGTSTGIDDESDLEPQKRGRGFTISDMNPASRIRTSQRISAERRPTLAVNDTSRMSSLLASKQNDVKIQKEQKGGVSPSSVFLQLYYQGCFGVGCFRPILLPAQNPEIDRAIKLFDLIKPHEHHRIGVLYVGPNQTAEAEIFGNTSGSNRYHRFLDGIGTVYDLEDFTEHTNLGGLDKRGSDGRLIHMWQDDLMQVVFHVATSMPNKESDPNGTGKKKHIGNDFVTIVYNNSGQPYNLNTIKSQFNHSVVEIVPGDHNTNCIRLLTKADLKDFVSWDKSGIIRLVSDDSLPLLGRQLALHANLASIVWESLHGSRYQPYATNWMERLKKVRKLRELVLGKTMSEKHLSEMQLLQLSTYDPNDLSYLDFSDMIEIDRASETKDRSRTAGFLNLR